MVHIDLRQKRGASKEHALDQEDMKILNDTLTLKNKIIYILGADAGLRVTEIEQMRFSWLKWVEIDGEKVLSINIPSKDRNILNKYELFQTKTRKERTTYIFNSDKAVYLYAWYESNHDGLVMTRQAIHKRVKTWEKYIKNKNLHPHALRSTAQNIWKFQYGFDDVFIQLCFGWKDLNTMITHYRTMNRATGESYLFNKIREVRK